jgi:hypothetical protein
MAADKPLMAGGQATLNDENVQTALEGGLEPARGFSLASRSLAKAKRRLKSAPQATAGLGTLHEKKQ